MSWRTKGAGGDDVCSIASGVANMTHVSLPSNNLYLHIWPVYLIISKLPPHHKTRCMIILEIFHLSNRLIQFSTQTVTPSQIY